MMSNKLVKGPRDPFPLLRGDGRRRPGKRGRPARGVRVVDLRPLSRAGRAGGVLYAQIGPLVRSPSGRSRFRFRRRGARCIDPMIRWWKAAGPTAARGALHSNGSPARARVCPPGVEAGSTSRRVPRTSAGVPLTYVVLERSAPEPRTSAALRDEYESGARRGALRVNADVLAPFSVGGGRHRARTPARTRSRQYRPARRRARGQNSRAHPVATGPGARASPLRNAATRAAATLTPARSGGHHPRATQAAGGED